MAAGEEEGNCTNTQSTVRVLHTIRSVTSDNALLQSNANFNPYLTPSRRVFIHLEKDAYCSDEAKKRLNAGNSPRGSRRPTSILDGENGEQYDEPKREIEGTEEEGGIIYTCELPPPRRQDGRPTQHKRQSHGHPPHQPDSYEPPSTVCDPDVRRYPPGMEPIKCFSVPVIPDHLRGKRTPKQPFYCTQADIQKNSFRYIAERAHKQIFQDRLLKMKPYERQLQASGHIPTYRAPDDPTVECYNPSKVIPNYDPVFTRAECLNPKWTLADYEAMLDKMYGGVPVLDEEGDEEGGRGRDDTRVDDEMVADEVEEQTAPTPPPVPHPPPEDLYNTRLKYDEHCHEKDHQLREAEQEYGLFLMKPCSGLDKRVKKKICKESSKKQAEIQQTLKAKAEKQSVWSFLGSAVKVMSDKAFFAMNLFADRGFLPGIKNVVLLESAMTIAEKIRSREYRCTQVVEAFIHRIEEINGLLNCVTYAEFEGAMKKAMEIDRILDNSYKVPEYRPTKMPLLGVPFCTQENIGVKGCHQTAGIRVRWKKIAPEDAIVVKRLKQAGAIFLAQTNTSEFGHPFETANRLYGRTKNPYDVRRTPGGSAGGAAALITAGGCPIGVAADFMGSMRISAAFCGIYAHKPISYAVEQKGVFPNIPSSRNMLLSVGPLAKHASDLLPLMTVISDPTESESGRHNWNKRVKLNQVTVYYLMSDGSEGENAPEPEIDQALRIRYELVLRHIQCILKMKIRKAKLPGLAHSCGMIMDAVMQAGQVPISEELTDRTCRKDVYFELARKLVGVSDHSMAVIVTAILEDRYRHGNNKDDKEATSTDRQQLSEAVQNLKRDFTALIGSKGIFVYPSYPNKVPFHGQTNFSWPSFAYTAIFNVLDLPVTQIPIGVTQDGLPLGLQIVTLRGCDHIAFAVANELGKFLCNWQPPCSTVPMPSLPKTRLCEAYLEAKLGRN